jgi:hypothetical protein
VSAVFLSGAVAAHPGDDDAEEPENPKIHVDKWLLLGPIDAPFPAFNEEDGEKEMKAGDLLAWRHLDLDGLWPLDGDKVQLIGGAGVEWAVVSAPDTGGVLIAVKEGHPRAAWLATYVSVSQWMEIDVDIRSTHPVEVFIDGESVVKNKKGGKMDTDAGESGEADLEMGKHLLVSRPSTFPKTRSRSGASTSMCRATTTSIPTLPSLSTPPAR